jgi:hypothetical protein
LKKWIIAHILIDESKDRCGLINSQLFLEAWKISVMNQRAMFPVNENRSYHELWLEALQAASENGNALEVMDQMLLSLNAEALRNPISFRPPTSNHDQPADLESQNSSICSASVAQSRASTGSAVFSALFDDGEDEEESSPVIPMSGNDRRRPIPVSRRDTSSQSMPGHQARYVRMMVRIALAELQRKAALERERHRAWSGACSAWQFAFRLVNVVSVDADEWYAIFFSVNDEAHPEPVMLQDGHHFSTLRSLLESLDLLRSHTEDERDRAVERFKREHDRILAEYDRLMNARAEAKRKLGDLWTQNPAPKKDHVDKIMELRGEVKTLREAIETMELLHLNAEFENL